MLLSSCVCPVPKDYNQFWTLTPRNDRPNKSRRIIGDMCQRGKGNAYQGHRQPGLHGSKSFATFFGQMDGAKRAGYSAMDSASNGGNGHPFRDYPLLRHGIGYRNTNGDSHARTSHGMIKSVRNKDSSNVGRHVTVPRGTDPAGHSTAAGCISGNDMRGSALVDRRDIGHVGLSVPFPGGSETRRMKATAAKLVPVRGISRVIATCS